MAMGLMSKPMLVTLPFILLFLDYWPLKRFPAPGPSQNARLLLKLVVEKIPIFFLSLISSIITCYAQHYGGAMRTFDSISFISRIANAAISYVHYMWKMIYPKNLVFFYPYSENLPIWQVLGSVIIVLIITFITTRAAWKHQFAIMGWLWYLGTLIPVIGLVQVGGQAMADRYTYIPLIGLFIMIAWGGPALLPDFRYRNFFFGMLAAFIIITFSCISWKQTGYWKNSIRLTEHAIKINPDNIVAHLNLGEALAEKGKLSEAFSHFEFILKKQPSHYDALINAGMALLNMQKPEDAMRYFDYALKIKPNSGLALKLCGFAKAETGKYEEAIRYYEKAIIEIPSDAELHFWAGIAYNAIHKEDRAAFHYQKALENNTQHVLAAINLGNIHYRAGRILLAEKIYQYALRIEPENSDVLSKMGAVNFSLGRAEKAVTFFNKALEISPNHQEAINGLKIVSQNKKEGNSHQ